MKHNKTSLLVLVVKTEENKREGKTLRCYRSVTLALFRTTGLAVLIRCRD